jgi:hypothetical protein
VENRIDTTNTARMTETTKNGEEMCMVQGSLMLFRLTNRAFSHSCVLSAVSHKPWAFDLPE